MNFATMLMGDIKITPRRIYHKEKTKPEFAGSFDQYKSLLQKPMTASQIAKARGMSYNGVKSFLDRALERGDIKKLGQVSKVKTGKKPTLYQWVN